MQRPGEPGAGRFGPPEGCVDHRPHRYRSFMIEEILTEPPGPKGAAPAAAAAAAAGELLKFGVQALLAARPFHSHLGTCGARAPAAGREGRAARREDAALGAWAPGRALAPAGKRRGKRPGAPEPGLVPAGRARGEGVRSLLHGCPAGSRPGTEPVF